MPTTAHGTQEVAGLDRTDESARTRTPGPRGVFCPIITPLDADERLDEAALRGHVERLVGGVDGIMVLGTGGELPILRDDVASGAIEVVADQLAGRLPLACGIGDAGTARAVDRAARAKEAGADYAAVCGPYYYRADSQAVTRHFAMIADASSLPVVLYNIPKCTHTPLDRDAVLALADHPNIVGIKDSTGDRDFFDWLLAARERTGWTVLQGTAEKRASEYWRSGMDGYVSGLENVAPGTMRALAQAVAAGDDGQAAALQERIDALVDLGGRHFWLSVIKGAVAEQGLGGGTVAAPLPSLDEAARADVRETLDRIGLLA
ncbi:dihydrodipicolinate synthase family protein [Phytoactinopolyspora halotolerans]|uniref:Dihydrodipicolinate synthase family protein n=1 Tax=Phytoactinopolyspora halotolerans TaxID=1981512 RepID=A0A6L9SD31_9ACTN|nr:dihydrodipicolinate synthase family protein [Phytoactinopolyspora halotolerans]NEE03136.1 dihydrodipicolinate synthase family protein [Phytoactinopolyspora halotolerans]